MRKTSSAGRHPARSLDRFAAGRATPAERRVVVRHLLAGCRPCGTRLAKLLTPKPADPDALTRVVDRAVSNFDRLEEQVGAELVAAEELIDRLRDLPAGRQRLMVANAERARQRAVCEELLSESRAHRHDSAADTLRYAELAVLAAERYTGRDAEELRARALAERGNALRIVGDLRAAERDLGAAQRLLHTAGCVDPLVEAQLLSLRASLADDQRQFDKAIALLRKAAGKFSRFDDVPGLARVFIKLGRVYGSLREPREGVAWVLQALKLLSSHQDSSLKLIALENLIYLVSETGETAEAAELIRYVRPVVTASAPRLERLRFDWLAARIDRQLGNAAAAVQALEQVRQGYLREQLPYEVALVSLDLAAAYAQQSRQADVRLLARDMAELFQRLGIEREHVAALGMLARVTAEKAVGLVVSLQAAVEQARGASSSLPAQVT